CLVFGVAGSVGLAVLRPGDRTRDSRNGKHSTPNTKHQTQIMAHNFPIARKLLAFAGQARRNWLARHQNTFNFWIHLVGIPLAVVGLPLLVLAPWYYGVGAIV